MTESAGARSRLAGVALVAARFAYRQVKILAIVA